MLLASQTNPEAAIGFVMTLEGFGSMLAAGEQPVCVVARVGDTPAGITFGGVQAGVLSIAYSGVDPAFRGRGIMRVVKERAHVVAARLGATVSNTTNEEHNAGIRSRQRRPRLRRAQRDLPDGAGPAGPPERGYVHVFSMTACSAGVVGSSASHP